MKMLSNNKTSLTFIKDLESQNQIKHIDIIYCHISKLVKDRELTTK